MAGVAPEAMTQQDIEKLRTQGFDDDAITVAVQVISYFAYINRVADGLHVDDEPWFSPSRDVWDRKRARDYGAHLTV